MKLLRLSTVVALLAFVSVPLHAQVTNGGFESGNASGWSVSGLCVDVGVDNFAPHGGTYGFFAGPVNDTCALSQTIATTIGTQYTFSFWLQNEGDPTATEFNTFEVLFGNQSLFATANALQSPYALKSFNVTANSASTTLEFRFRNDFFYWDLDDVNVAAFTTTVPEPSTIALMGAGLLGLAAARIRRRRRS